LLDAVARGGIPDQVQAHDLTGAATSLR